MKGVYVFALTILSVAVSAKESVLVFGNNQNGQLGVADSVVNKPTAIPSFEGKCIKHAATTSHNSIFVTCDGKVYVSGVGIAPNGAFSLKPGASAKDPVLVEQLTGYQVAMAGAGDGHFVVLTNDNKVLTWGQNHDGQLGYGNDVPFASSPLEIEMLSHRNIRMVAAGGNRTGAVSDDGKLYMWGAGTKGEMGDGTTRSHRKPTLVQAFLPNNERVCQVAIGAGHVAAVTTAGDLYTWGDGNAGQLGLGDFGIQQKKPSPVSRLRRNVCFATAGEDFTAVITQDERVFLWGSNGYPNPFEKSYFQGKKARQISSGISHMVVLLNDGTLSSWGSRRVGQAGRDFSTQFTLDPGSIENVGNVSQITTGDQQTIVLSGSGYPAVSLCSCLGMWYGHWRAVEQYKASCTDEQQQCGDDSCCAAGTTCCPIDDRAKKSIAKYRAIDEKPSPEETTGYRCMPAKNAVCCSPLSGLSCPTDYTCNLDSSPKRCQPSNLPQDISEEDIASKSEEPFRSSVFSSFPGVVSGQGVCGARKETCPDDTCCGKTQSCCPMKDGSFGCCPYANGKCCAAGCCAEGYSCDDEHGTCVKTEAGSTAIIAVKEQENVEGHCGSGKRQCPDRSCCADSAECCVLSDGFFGCCPFQNGVCCVDGAGCCPSGYSCDVSNNECVRPDGPDGKEVRVSLKSTPRNTPQRSAGNEVTCPNGMACQYPGTCCDNGNNQFTCCDFINGTCCAGGLGCCPSDFECDLDGSSCKPVKKGAKDVPMKFTRDPKPKQHVDTTQGAPEICTGQTKCADNTCCPIGATCCQGANGETTCCDYMNAICCEGGGCCSADHMCDSKAKVCRDASGSKSYPFLPEVKSEPPPPSTENKGISNPGKCFPDEMKCESDFCCPRGGSCCDKAFGQKGCCPHTHGVCCDKGGCCPGGSVCDPSNNQCLYPDQPSKQPAPMLLMDTPRAPESEWDLEECWTDEQSCSIDGGCCLKTETCCVVTVEGKKQSACCPFENGVCCQFGGCCPSDGICDEEKGTCLSAVTGDIIDNSPVRGSAVHPLSMMSEIDCPDGSVCGGFDTCCSLGFDEGWGEEVYACCPFENAVCCTEFVGCCPNGYECDAEAQACVSGTREISVGTNNPTDPPPTFVCLWPSVQCPNYKCCEKDYQCVEQSGGNYKCLPRGYASCDNGTTGCPQSLFCDHREDGTYCSEEVDNDPQIKEEIIKKYWGDNPVASCAAMALADNALIQQQEFHFHEEIISPEVKEPSLTPPKVIVHPPPQYWYPKRLAIRSKAAKATSTHLPSLLAAKVCQHLHVNDRNSGAPTEFCYSANSNGHFVMKERDRVQTLVSEYSRRLCNDQKCLAAKGRTWEALPEELDPCPCRPKPTPIPEPAPVEDFAGTNPNAAVVAESIAQAEASADEALRSSSEAAPFIVPVVDLPDEKPVSSVGMGTTSSGTVPVNAEKPVEEDSPVKFTLVMPTRDQMQLSPPLEVENFYHGEEMKQATQAETFMGKEACNNVEDDAETAVDLDGDEAVKSDAASDRLMQETSLAQMEANSHPGNNVMMPEDQ